MDIPFGYCQCGCGQKTSIAKENEPEWGVIKGQPRRFKRGHCNKANMKPINERFFVEFHAGGH